MMISKFLPPSCSTAMRSCSRCFSARCFSAARSMALELIHRDSMVNITATRTMATATDEETIGFLNGDFGSEGGSLSIAALRKSVHRKNSVKGDASGRADSRECAYEMGIAGRVESARERLSKLPPSDKFEVLVAQNRFELRTCEEVEVALPPGGAPGVALARCGAHFVIGEGQMNDEYRDSWL